MPYQVWRRYPMYVLSIDQVHRQRLNVSVIKRALVEDIKSELELTPWSRLCTLLGNQLSLDNGIEKEPSHLRRQDVSESLSFMFNTIPIDNPKPRFGRRQGASSLASITLHHPSCVCVCICMQRVAHFVRNRPFKLNRMVICLFI